MSQRSEMSQWRKLRRLQARELVLIPQIAVLLPVTALALRAFGFQKVCRILERLQKASKFCFRGDCPENEALIRIGRTLRVTTTILNYSPFRVTCLPRSLVLRHVLGLQGITTELRIGVSGEGDGFEAHAWIEYQGQPVAENKMNLKRFQPFDEKIRPDQWAVESDAATLRKMRS